jgi:phosphoglycerate kinase
MEYNTLDDLAVKGKRVLVRADLNVPLKDGIVTDATRIARQAPTIRELAEKGAKVILLSHFDRPKGKRVPSMSLRPVVAPLAKLLGVPVAFANDCIGETAASAVAAMHNGDVLLLENLRFHAGEEADDQAFAQALAADGDLYVDEPPTALTPPPTRWRSFCRPMPARRCAASWRRWKRRSARRSGRCSASSAARKCRPSSTCSTT